MTSSCYYYVSKRRAREEWPYEYIDAYAGTWQKLLAYDKNYPAPEYLYSIVAIGNIQAEVDTSVMK